MRRYGIVRSFLFITLSVFYSSYGFANTESADTGTCNPPLFTSTVTDKLDTDKTRIAADSTQLDEKQTIFEGDVVITQNDRRISSDKASHIKESGDLKLFGNVQVEADGIQFSAESGHFNINNDVGELNQARYYLNENAMRGTANTVLTKTTDDTITQLFDTSLTSCPPQKQDWLLSAKAIELNHNEEYGSADDVVIEFMDVPFFYTPYMEFPIGDKRRSGLLFPEWSSSDRRGFELIVPWYWNIAPNMDATLAPHFMEKRGTQLDSKFRFLTHTTTGELNSAFLARDDVTREKRYHTEYKQHTRIINGLNLNIDIRDVSDTDYFDDFNNSLSDTSQTHLNRSAALSYAINTWRSRLLIQSYETVDANILTANRPYRKLPQLTINGSELLTDSNLRFQMQSEWIAFDHEDSSRTTGSRLHLSPGLDWLFQGASWYAQPAIEIHHTQYDVVDGNDNHITLNNRTVPISSFDTGIVLERTLSNGLLQTLEPRLYYLHAPLRDQSDIPIFDSSIPTFSFAQLFRNNRFNGKDRIGDANQLTTAISTRLIDPANGDEFLRGSIGQITYFDDRRVSIDNTVSSQSQSDLIAELSTRWRHWQARASAQWDTDTDRNVRQNFQLQYQSDKHRIFNLAQRKRRSDNSVDDIDQTDVSFVSPLTDNTILYGRWNYSHAEHQDIDIIAGLGYESCCWSLQLLAQRQRLSNTEYDNTFMLQLVLKGLGSVTGNRLENTLQNAITGYR